MARKTDTRVRLYSRPGNDLTDRFLSIFEAVARLRAHSCIIDGEAVSCGEDGIALFERIRYRRHADTAFLYAFDLIELNGVDLRREPLETRKATLASVLRRGTTGLRFNEHLEHEDGALVFEQACAMGLEGIVSKRRGSAYRSGRTGDCCASPAARHCRFSCTYHSYVRVRPRSLCERPSTAFRVVPSRSAMAARDKPWASYACNRLSLSGVQKLPRIRRMHDVQSESHSAVNRAETLEFQ